MLSSCDKRIYFTLIRDYMTGSAGEWWNKVKQTKHYISIELRQFWLSHRTTNNIDIFSHLICVFAFIVKKRYNIAYFLLAVVHLQFVFKQYSVKQWQNCLKALFSAKCYISNAILCNTLAFIQREIQFTKAIYWKNNGSRFNWPNITFLQ